MNKYTIFPIQLSEALWVLGTYHFNLYLVKGKHASALIEVGVSAIVDRVISQLEELKVSPAYLLVTHPHTDHISGLNGLRERFPGAVCIAGQGAQEFLDHPKALNTMLNEDKFITDALSMFGVRPGRPPIDKAPFLGNHLAIKDKQDIDLGGYHLQCMPVKGHSPGNIAVHIPALSALILSDSLGFHFPGREFLPLYFTGFADYIATLDFFKSLNPTIIGLGHQGPLTGADVNNAFKKARQAATDLSARIKQEERDDEEVADALFRKFYRDEFAIYSEENIRNCTMLLVRRAREA